MPPTLTRRALLLSATPALCGAMPGRATRADERNLPIAGLDVTVWQPDATTPAPLPVVIFSQDFSVHGGSIGKLGSAKTQRALQIAITRGLPLVMVLDGGGHRIQDGQDSRHFAHANGMFHNFARASGWIPMVALMLGAGFRGSVKKNFEPTPTSLDTPISPPISSTSLRTMDRPKPVPPASRERAASTR